MRNRFSNVFVRCLISIGGAAPSIYQTRSSLCDFALILLQHLPIGMHLEQVSNPAALSDQARAPWYYLNNTQYNTKYVLYTIHGVQRCTVLCYPAAGQRLSIQAGRTISCHPLVPGCSLIRFGQPQTNVRFALRRYASVSLRCASASVTLLSQFHPLSGSPHTLRF